MHLLEYYTLVTFLFIIVLDYTIKKATENLTSLSIPGGQEQRRYQTSINFTEDISLLSDNLSTAQELIWRVEAECERTGLHLNAKKIEYMALIFVNS